MSCAVCLALSWGTHAQEKVFFVPEPETARWSYLEKDADGTTVATIAYSVGTMNGDAVNGSVRLKMARVGTQSPADTLNSFLYYRFKDGECMVDMGAFFEADALAGLINAAAGDDVIGNSQDEKDALDEIRKHIEVSGEIGGIPRYPVVGELPDYQFVFKLSILNISVKGTDRKICGQEAVVTPAGTFDCYILEETVTTKALMQKDVEKTVSWYAYGIGMVKENTYDKKGKLVSTTILNSINW